MTSEAADRRPELFGMPYSRFGNGFRRFGHFIRIRMRFISVLCTKTVTLQE